MEATHKTSLAKGEVGLRDRKPAPTLRQFAEGDFLPFARSTFAAKPKTLEYYENGVKSLLAFQKIADCRLDTVTGETIGEFVGKRRNAGLEVSSVNRELQVLRRMFRLAQEWGKVEKALPNVKRVPGEKHRERVLTAEEEDLYFRAAGSEAMEQHADPRLLADVTRILLDCGLRPEECFRLKPANVVEGKLVVHFGKTGNCPAPHSNNAERASDPRYAPYKSGRRGVGFPGANSKRPYRAFQPQETARKGRFGGRAVTSARHGRPEASFRALRTLHPASHLPNPLGTPHGPLDPCLPCRAPGHEHHEAIYSPAREHHSCRDGKGACGEG